MPRPAIAPATSLGRPTRWGSRAPSWSAAKPAMSAARRSSISPATRARAYGCASRWKGSAFGSTSAGSGAAIPSAPVTAPKARPPSSLISAPRPPPDIVTKSLSGSGSSGAPAIAVRSQLFTFAPSGVSFATFIARSAHAQSAARGTTSERYSARGRSGADAGGAYVAHSLGPPAAILPPSGHSSTLERWRRYSWAAAISFDAGSSEPKSANDDFGASNLGIARATSGLAAAARRIDISWPVWHASPAGSSRSSSRPSAKPLPPPPPSPRRRRRPRGPTPRARACAAGRRRARRRASP